jgi:hypothetical protein
LRKIEASQMSGERSSYRDCINKSKRISRNPTKKEDVYLLTSEVKKSRVYEVSKS